VCALFVGPQTLLFASRSQFAQSNDFTSACQNNYSGVLIDLATVAPGRINGWEDGELWDTGIMAADRQSKQEPRRAPRKRVHAWRRSSVDSTRESRFKRDLQRVSLDTCMPAMRTRARRSRKSPLARCHLETRGQSFCKPVDFSLKTPHATTDANCEVGNFRCGEDGFLNLKHGLKLMVSLLCTDYCLTIRQCSLLLCFWSVVECTAVACHARMRVRDCWATDRTQLQWCI